MENPQTQATLESMDNPQTQATLESMDRLTKRFLL
jgi:hypothetical protein